jgi:hypothetical protein
MTTHRERKKKIKTQHTGQKREFKEKEKRKLEREKGRER